MTAETTTFEAMSALGDDFVDTESYSDALLRSLAIIPKCTSILSIAGSLWIILEVLSKKEKQKLVYHRLLFGFAIMDTIATIGTFLTTWPMPRGTEDAIGAMGTVATCEMQGFLIQLGIATPIYSAMLSIYYVLVINYNISERRVHRRYEGFFHGIPVVFGVSTAIAALSLNMYNEANLWCWIAAHPDGCLHTQGLDSHTGDSGEQTTSCERGDGAYLWRWGVYYGPIWLCFLIVLVCLILVWREVRRQEIKTARFQHRRTNTNAARSTDPAAGDPAAAAAGTGQSHHSPRNHGAAAAASHTTQSSVSRAMSRLRRQVTFMKTTSSLSTNQPPRQSWQVLTQCLCYIVVFYLCYLFGSIVRIQQQLAGKTNVVLLLMHCFFLPLQGFFNFLIYRRPYYLRLRRKHSSNSRWWVLKKCLEIKSRNHHHHGGSSSATTGCCCCCCCSSCWNNVLRLKRAPFARGTPPPAVVVNHSLSERLDQIRNSHKLTSRQRQLATLEEMDVIAARELIVHLSSSDDEDAAAEQAEDVVVVEAIAE